MLFSQDATRAVQINRSAAYFFCNTRTAVEYTILKGSMVNVGLHIK